MPFGKWKGYPVEEVDTDYLLWVINNLRALNPRLRLVILSELEYRGIGRHQRQAATTPPPPPPPPPPPRACVRCQTVAQQLREAREVFTRFYRRLSLLCHPDRGGTHAAQATLNECREEMT